MAGKISTSFSLVKSSARVLAADKELLVFPAISGVASLLVVATFFGPLAVLGGFGLLEEGGALAYAFGFLFYLAQYTVIFFFNTALVGAAVIRLEGGDPTVADGLSIAFDRIGRIVEYAALAATVGMILKAVEERVGALGRFVVGLIGVSWTMATYLAVPVLVTRDVGPLDAVKESASLFKETWGEQVVGNFGMGLAFFLMFLSFTLFAVPVVWLGSMAGPYGVGVGIGFVVLGYVTLALVSAALKGIYQAALYRYATEGDAGWGFDRAVLQRAFAPK